MAGARPAPDNCGGANATIDAYILTQNEDARIFLHRALECGVDRLHQAEFGHGAPCTSSLAAFRCSTRSGGLAA